MNGVCPFFGARDELKALGDYPKCPGSGKCAIWSEKHNKCALVAVAEEIPSELDQGLYAAGSKLENIANYLGTMSTWQISDAFRQLAEQGAAVATLFGPASDVLRDLRVILAWARRLIDEPKRVPSRDDSVDDGGDGDSGTECCERQRPGS